MTTKQKAKEIGHTIVWLHMITGHLVDLRGRNLKREKNKW